MTKAEVKAIAKFHGYRVNVRDNTAVIFTGFENVTNNDAPYIKEKEEKLLNALENATTRTFTQWGHKAHQIRVTLEA